MLVNFLYLLSLLSISADCSGLNFVLSVCTVLCVGIEKVGGGDGVLKIIRINYEPSNYKANILLLRRFLPC